MIESCGLVCFCINLVSVSVCGCQCQCLALTQPLVQALVCWLPLQMEIEFPRVCHEASVVCFSVAVWPLPSPPLLCVPASQGYAMIYVDNDVHAQPGQAALVLQREGCYSFKQYLDKS